MIYDADDNHYGDSLQCIQHLYTTFISWWSISNLRQIWTSEYIDNLNKWLLFNLTTKGKTKTTPLHLEFSGAQYPQKHRLVQSPLSTLRITNWLVGWFKSHFFSPQQLPTCLAATCSGSHSVDAVEDTDAEGVGPSMADFFWTGVFLTTYQGAINLCS